MTSVGNRVALSLAAAATVAAWIFTIQNAGAMSGAMPMPGGWRMSMAWMPMGDQSAVERAALFLVMWTVMMIAMMLPSVMPVILLHDRLMQSRRERGEGASGSNLLLLTGYFATWTGFGAVAYALDVAATTAAMRYAPVSRAVPVATGLTLIAAGAYQLTAWKQICLNHCRSPLDFFSHHPIRRAGDSLTLGIHHGIYCAACCWALMAIQLVLGVMSVPLMATVALVILLEKSWRHGQWLAMVVGAVAVAGGALLAWQAAC